MRLIPTRRIPDGAKLARDILTGAGDAIPLLRAGTVVSSRYRDGLARSGIHAVYIDDALSEGIEVVPPISDETRREATRAVSNAIVNVKECKTTIDTLSDMETELHAT